MEFESYSPATCTLILSIPSNYVAQYIEENYIQHLRIAISNTFGKIQLKWHTIIVKKDDSTTTNTSTSQTKRSGKDIGYTYEGAVDTKSGDGPAKAALATNNTQELILAPGSVTHVQEIDSQLNLHQTFDNYVEGESNKFCRSIGLTIAEHPQGTQFNPMFVHGPSGCGKTHLVNAIGLRCKEIYKNKRVLYVSAREFQMQYTNANMQGKINDFIGFYQTIDMLIVDDVQEWLNSAKTQETFFHIFNHLFRTDKRIILVSDRPPIQLSGMMDRLITRFSCGVLAEMEKPNVQLCVDILKRKIQRDGLHISEPVIRYIAENVNGSIREIQGIIKELQSKCGYDNVCLDSISELERAMLAYFGRIGNNKGVPTLQDYQRVDYYIIDWCRQLRTLPCNVIFTAWEKYADNTSPSGEKYTRISPMLRDKNVENLCGLCDMVGRIVTNTEDKERYVWLDGRLDVVAKDRIYKRKFCKFGEVLSGGTE